MGKFYDSVPVSAIVRIRDMMYTVKDPFRLDQGDVSFDAPETFKQAVAKAMTENRTHYLPTAGIPPLRKAFAEKMRTKNHIPVGSDDEILVTNGGTHGLFAVFHALLEPGDEVIVPDPEWPPTMAMMQAAGGKAVQVPLREGLRIALGYRRGRAGDHAEDARALPELAEQPVRRRADAGRHRAAGGDRARAQPVGGLGRSVRRRRLSRRAHQHRVAAGHVRPHHPGLHAEQVVRDHRRARRLLRDQGQGAARSRAQGRALHHQQRLVDRPVRRRRRARRLAAVHRGFQTELLSAATCSTKGCRKRRRECFPARRPTARSTRS